MISDETVQELYQRCYSKLVERTLDPEIVVTQIYWGVTSKYWKNNPHPGGCRRHLAVFKLSNVIPEYCFGCYKVSIVPRTVVELFKLMMVFKRLKLPNDNTRKCMIELRPQISGAYKGYIYCQSVGDGKEILNIVRALVGEDISRDIPVSLKRGCSEYPLVYPEYGYSESDEKPLMAYKEEWRKQEASADKALAKQLIPTTLDSHNHPGFNMRDTLVMRTWLAYAATIGDASYLTISQSPVCQMPKVKRPPFQTMDDS